MLTTVKHGSQHPPTYTPRVFPDSPPSIKESITKIITIQIKKQEVRSPIILVIVTLETVRIVTAPARVKAKKQIRIKLLHIPHNNGCSLQASQRTPALPHQDSFSSGLTWTLNHYGITNNYH